MSARIRSSPNQISEGTSSHFYFWAIYSFKSIALVLYDSFMCYLHTVGDFLPVREDLCQVLCTQHVPQGGLCQQTSGCISIGDVGYCQRCVLNTVVDYTIYTHGHRVLCQHLSGWMHKDYLIKNIIWVIKTTTTRKRKHKHTLLVKNYNIHFFLDFSIFYIFIVILWNIITI